MGCGSSHEQLQAPAQSLNRQMVTERDNAIIEKATPKDDELEIGNSQQVDLNNLSADDAMVDTTGVSMGFLQAFVRDHKNALQGLTTADVCKRYIKPDTEESKTSYTNPERNRPYPSGA